MFTNEMARVIARAVITLAMLFIGYWIFVAYIWPFFTGLFHVLQVWLQHYLSLYTSSPNVGKWAAWILIAFAIGLLNRGLVTAAGAGIVLILTIGLLTRGPVYMVPHGGNLVDARDPSVRAMGQFVAAILIVLLVAVVVGYVISVGINVVTPAAALPAMAHLGGYFAKEELQYVKWKLLAVIGAFVLFTIIAKDATPTDVNNLMGWVLVLGFLGGILALGFGLIRKGWRTAVGS